MWRNESDITYDEPLGCLWFHMYLWCHNFFYMISHICDITLWHPTLHHMWRGTASHDIHTSIISKPWSYYVRLFYSLHIIHVMLQLFHIMSLLFQLFFSEFLAFYVILCQIFENSYHFNYFNTIISIFFFASIISIISIMSLLLITYLNQICYVTYFFRHELYQFFFCFHYDSYFY